MKKTHNRQQFSFIKAGITQHGGSLALHTKRKRRPLNTKLPLHVTLKSNLATKSSGRCLYKHKNMIIRIMRKAAIRFNVKVYNYAICGNHIHLLVKADFKFDIQNFFRVFAGHTAQNILKKLPLNSKESSPLFNNRINKGGAPYCSKNQRKFWSYIVYTRMVSWGRDYQTVYTYIEKNIMELLNIITYRPRKKEMLI